MVGALEKLIISHADWWAIAGYDSAVADDSASWFDAEKPSRAASAPGAPAISTQSNVASAPAADTRGAERSRGVPAPTADPLADMPAELSAFRAWLASSPAAQWGGTVVLPSGPANAPVMILSEYPEAEDDAAGQLHSDRAGELLDAMLAAIGLSRADCYLASLAVTRPPGGRIAEEQRAVLDAMMMQHIALAAPKNLLVLGNRMSRLFGATDVVDAQTKLREINHHGLNMVATAIYHPRFLLGRPQYKAITWTSLKRLRKLL